VVENGWREEDEAEDRGDGIGEADREVWVGVDQ